MVLMEQYLQATPNMDTASPPVQSFAWDAVGDAATNEEKAIRLYDAVRDGIRYNPYSFSIDPAAFVASAVLESGESFCIPKAILLATAARIVGIPSRLQFADVRNHLSSPRALEILRTDVFTFHGSTELYLEGRWVKVTPAFNRSLCDKMKVATLDFDGRNDAIFQPFDTEGRQFMDYLHDHGSFADLPYEKMVAAFAHHYPHLFGADAPVIEGDMEAEV
jgi:transglutaminase-like putative cysteine protease